MLSHQGLFNISNISHPYIMSDCVGLRVFMFVLFGFIWSVFSFKGFHVCIKIVICLFSSIFISLKVTDYWLQADDAEIDEAQDEMTWPPALPSRTPKRLRRMNAFYDREDTSMWPELIHQAKEGFGPLVGPYRDIMDSCGSNSVEKDGYEMMAGVKTPDSLTAPTLILGDECSDDEKEDDVAKMDGVKNDRPIPTALRNLNDVMEEAALNDNEKEGIKAMTLIYDGMVEDLEGWKLSKAKGENDFFQKQYKDMVNAKARFYTQWLVGDLYVAVVESFMHCFSLTRTFSSHTQLTD